MFDDHCEAIRFGGTGWINYYIGKDRCTRKEFHKYRAEKELTDFVGTLFSIPNTYNKITIGHWSSFIDYMTNEYIRLLEYFDNDEDDAGHCLLMDCRDKFMTYYQMNYMYHRGEELKYIKNVCSKKRYESCKKCNHAPEDIRTCVDIDERKRSDDAYNSWMMKELNDELEAERGFGI